MGLKLRHTKHNGRCIKLDGAIEVWRTYKTIATIKSSRTKITRGKSKNNKREKNNEYKHGKGANCVTLYNVQTLICQRFK